MSRVLAESAANADFATGHAVPVNGDSGTQWWNVVIGAIQASGDREQALAKLLGVNGSNQVTVCLPLTDSYGGLAANWSLGTAAGYPFSPYWLQFANTYAGNVIFPLNLPVGAKLTTITARLAGGGPFVAPSTHSGLPATKPRLTIARVTDGVPTLVGNVTDSSSTTGAYDAMHTLTLTANHTVQAGCSYHAVVEGESGTNSLPAALTLANLSYTLAFA